MKFPLTFVYQTNRGKVEQVVTNIEDYNYMVGWLGNKFGARDEKWFIKEERKRSLKQNASGHKFFTDIAEALNDAGLDQVTVMSKQAYSYPNTPESVKTMFRIFAKNMYGHDSTKDLSTEEWVKVCDVMTREFGEKFGIQVDYPSEETLLMKDRLRREK
jgi:hypothetical protein